MIFPVSKPVFVNENKCFYLYLISKIKIINGDTELYEQHATILTDKEQEFVNLLVSIGTRKNIATVLVFFAHTPEATSGQIERGTGLRQPGISMAIQFMLEQCWVAWRNVPSDRDGRLLKSYSLAVPFREIIGAIGKEKRKNVNDQLGRIRKIRTHLAAVSERGD